MPKLDYLRNTILLIHPPSVIGSKDPSKDLLRESIEINNKLKFNPQRKILKKSIPIDTNYTITQAISTNEL